MSYLSLYRKWRPQDFNSLVGQDHIKITLENSITKNKVAHAYLFSGPRGTGKTSVAKIFSKALNCNQKIAGQPCNTCSNCEQINQGSSMDVYEIDAASNRGIDEIRTLRDNVHFLPMNARYKVYIIDEVHMLTNEAFNALLKTLEEPPSHAIFILATTEPQKIPATIHSRCQRYDFHRISTALIIERLQEVAEKSSIAVDDEALQLIAINSDGGMRDALSLLDQCSVMGQNITIQTVRNFLGMSEQENLCLILKLIASKDLLALLQTANALLATGKESAMIISELINYTRSVLIYQVAPTYADIYLTDNKENLGEIATLFTQTRLLAIIKRLQEATMELKTSSRAAITLELALIDICENTFTESGLMARVEELENKINQLTISPTVITPVQAKTISTANSVATTVEKFSTAVQNNAAQSSASFSDISVAPITPESFTNSMANREIATTVIETTKTAPTTMPQATTQNISTMTKENLWQEIFAHLKKQGKRSVMACLENAEISSFDDKLIHINASSQFICDKILEEDYCLLLEKIIKTILGQDLKIDCKIASVQKKNSKIRTAPPKVEPVEVENTAIATEAPVDTRESWAVQKALEVFGGILTKLDE